jgi:molybdopterin molybdotransferase
MIEIDQALSLVLSKCDSVSTHQRPVAEAVGYVLAENICADVDSPPHDKSLVDGFAIRVDDADKELQLLEQVVAGAVPTLKIEPGTTSQVMTGAPIPEGTEAMVMVENAEQEGDLVRISGKVEASQFIMPRATTFAQDDIVLAMGTRIRPIEVGLLCEVGRDEVICGSKPKIAVLPTGDELVDCSLVPGPGQIRNSNGPMLEARVSNTGCEVISLGVGRDAQAELRSKIEQGLAADILLLSGGVSAGVRDLVPATLSSLGVEEVFHKVRLKPGKPLWFGTRTKDGSTTLVFGLPGNPVSSLVCLELFVLPAIRVLSGDSPHVEMLPVRLAEPFQQRGNRPTYYPGKTYREEGRTFVRPLPWQGSADMLTISRADCLIYFMPGDGKYQVGDKLMALPLA